MISMVSVMELLVGPLRKGRNLNDVVDFIHRFQNFECVPLDYDEAHCAAEVRARSGLRPPDAIIIGAAEALNVDCIITNDAQWSGKSEIPVVTVGNYIA